jgi:hypothetical protein
LFCYKIFDAAPCSPGGSFIDQDTRTQPISNQAHSGAAILTFGFLAHLLFLAPANVCAKPFTAAASGTVAVTGASVLTETGVSIYVETWIHRDLEKFLDK